MKAKVKVRLLPSERAVKKVEQAERRVKKLAHRISLAEAALARWGKRRARYQTRLDSGYYAARDVAEKMKRALGLRKPDPEPPPKPLPMSAACGYSQYHGMCNGWAVGTYLRKSKRKCQCPCHAAAAAKKAATLRGMNP